MRIRKDVWKLATDPQDKTLHWYSVAVAEMQSRLFNNPLSWKFQAAVHGYDASVYPALRPNEKLPTGPIQKKYWYKCQHASWHFLSWHRIFVYLFEKMCRDAISAKGGPADWALPYWDYSHPSNAVQRTLPKEFRSSSLPDGSANPLYAVRGAGVNTGGAVGSDAQSENTTCLKSKAFSGAFPNGFGGGQSKPMQFSHYTGSCENGPHNQMHDAIGGPTGWMDNPDAAALDPIFWLHHSNIDRLWVIWDKDPSHTLPPDATWNKQKFEFFDATGTSKSFVAQEVLQTTGPLCDYEYEDTTSPLAAQPAAVVMGIAGRFGAHAAAGTEKGSAVAQSGKGTAPKEALKKLAAKAMNKAQVVGASEDSGIELKSDATSVAFQLHAPAPIAQVGKKALAVAESAPEAQRVYLNLENVTAQDVPIHTYEVYVNVPKDSTPAKHPELMAGLIARFGLAKASKPDSTHSGQGLNLSFDVTDIVAGLDKSGSWDPQNIRVTFAPHDLDEASTLAKEGRAVQDRQPVKIGRVSVSIQ
jgi:tyrosinase